MYGKIPCFQSQLRQVFPTLHQVLQRYLLSPVKAPERKQISKRQKVKYKANANECPKDSV